MSEFPADLAVHTSVLDILERRVDSASQIVAVDLEIALQEIPLFPADRILAIGQKAGGYLERHPETAIQLGIELVGSDVPTIRAFAVVLIARFSRFHPAIWKDIIRHLLTDQSWEVRQLAAHAFDSYPHEEGAADFHFDFVLDMIGDWAKHQDYLVRYAASQALLGYAAKNPEIGQRILGAIDPLFNDPSDHVRNGAQGAMRTIGKRRPDLVLSFIELKLDTLGEFEREVYLHVLNEPFAAKNPEWRDRIQSAITAAAPYGSPQ